MEISKNIFLLFLVINALYASTLMMCSASKWRDRIYDPTTSEFQRRHEYALGTIAKDRDQGKLWKQVTKTHIPLNFATGYPDPVSGTYTEISQLEWYHDNYYDQDSGSFIAEQAWPKYDVNGTFVGYGMQRIALQIEEPYFRRDFDEDATSLFKESFQQYGVEWLSEYLPESFLVRDTTANQAAMGRDTTCMSWYPNNNGASSSVYYECLNNAVPQELRYYSLNVPVDLIQGDPSTRFVAWSTIRSTAEVPPQMVSDAFADFKSGNVDLLPDPLDPSVNIRLWVPPSNSERQERSVRPEIPGAKALHPKAREIIEKALKVKL